MAILLLNVGPTARGTFDCRADGALARMGEWMKYNSRSIYGCTQAPETYIAPEHTLLTFNTLTRRLYVHLVDYPLQNMVLKGFSDHLKYAQFLHDASEIKMEKAEDDLRLTLPVNKPNVEIPVIELFLK